MASAQASEPIPIHAHALENLRYIRATMEKAETFTAVPGWGGMWMGVTALFAAAYAATQPTAHQWLMVWVAEGFLAFVIGLATMWRKVRRLQGSVLSSSTRKFALNFAPPVIVGCLLTIVLHRAGLNSALPGVWMAVYGCSVVAAGAFSVRVVPVMGVCFLLLGAVTLFCPPQWHNWLLGLGFGCVHIGFGINIARRHGG